MRPFVDPEKSGNKVILARLYFPLISESVILQSIHPLYGMTTDIGYVQKTQIESRCDVMKPKKLIRRSAVNGRVMAKNVSYDIRRKEMEKKKTDDQKFIDDVNFELSSVEIPEI